MTFLILLIKMVELLVSGASARRHQRPCRCCDYLVRASAVTVRAGVVTVRSVIWGFSASELNFLFARGDVTFLISLCAM